MNDKIKRYTIVSSIDPEALEREVNKLLNYGWFPFGSIAIVYPSSEIRYVQPMVKYEDE